MDWLIHTNTANTTEWVRYAFTECSIKMRIWMMDSVRWKLRWKGIRMKIKLPISHKNAEWTGPCPNCAKKTHREDVRLTRSITYIAECQNCGWKSNKFFTAGRCKSNCIILDRLLRILDWCVWRWNEDEPLYRTYQQTKEVCWKVEFHKDCTFVYENGCKTALTRYEDDVQTLRTVQPIH